MDHITRLEERLAGVEALPLKKALAADLSSMEQRLRARIAGRLPPDEFTQASALADAALAAQEVLARWPTPPHDH